MTLEELIASQPDHRELKRALVVKMRIKGMKHREKGIEGILLKHKGSRGYLNQEERRAVRDWIQEKKQRTLWDVIEHIKQKYKIVDRSMQSYYDLLKEAGMSWHKGRKKVPDTMSLWCSNTTK